MQQIVAAMPTGKGFRRRELADYQGAFEHANVELVAVSADESKRSAELRLRLAPSFIQVFLGPLDLSPAPEPSCFRGPFRAG